VYKPCRTHVVTDVLSRLPDVTEPIGVLDQTKDASLFYTKPKWLIDVKEFLRIRQIQGMLTI
jgi:hypothetical protein